MEKPRYALALFLSFLVLIAWQYFLAPKQPPKADKPTAPAPAPAPVGDQPPSPTPVQPGVSSPSEVPEQDVTVETKLWKAVFSNRGGVVKKWVLKQLPNGKPLKDSNYQELNLLSPFAIKHAPTDPTVELGYPFQMAVKSDAALEKLLNTSGYGVNTKDSTIFVNEGAKTELVFSLEDPASGLSVRKSFTFHGDGRDGKGYVFDFSVSVKRGGTPVATDVLLAANFGDQSGKAVDNYVHTPPQAVVFSGSPHYIDGSKATPEAPQTVANATWCALTDNYFALAFIPPKESPNAVVSSRKLQETINGKQGERTYVALHASAADGVANSMYIGPKDRTYLLPVNELFSNRVDLEVLVNYGFFSFLVRPLIPILDLSVKLLNHYTHNYGWAIIGITFFINMLLFPLKWKSSVALRRAAKMQGRAKEIQEEVKKLKPNDPRLVELQMEQARIMRGTLSGCLPLFIQLPIFWAFFLYLQLSVDIRQSSFVGWLSDLSAPDRLHILPIAMCVTQILTTLLMPSPPSDDPAQKMQKTLMTWVFPVMLTWFFFWNAPSGLVLYWMAGNVIGITQQLIINKMNPPDPPDPQPTKATGKLAANAG